MKHKRVRSVIGLTGGFVSLTAIGGGIAILVGADRFPSSWLRETPFRDYTIPAILLAFAVGGSSLIAALSILTGGRGGVVAAMAAGIILVGYIAVEVLILKQVPPGPTTIEIFYFALGLLIFVLGAYLWRVENSRPGAAA